MLYFIKNIIIVKIKLICYTKENKGVMYIMKTVVITDVKYRFTISAIRSLGKAGFNIVVTQTKKECSSTPASVYSKYVSQIHMIEGSCKDKSYKEKLIKILSIYDRPILLCMGADTLRMVATNKTEFNEVADFTVSDISVIDSLNDKEIVHERAKSLGILVPVQYKKKPDSYPVVIKPHCGELLGLKAEERYGIANNEIEYNELINKMKKYDKNPIVQQKIIGDGIGVCLLIDKKGNLVNAYCHKRIREYPTLGGPSSCCESFYDEEMINSAYKLLKSFNFCGYAMVEFKGNYILEVNPRIWGSFPLAECINSGFTESYVNISCGKKVKYIPGNFDKNVRIHFILNDILSILGYLKKGRIKKVFVGIKDIFMAKEALYDKHDKKPFFKYIKNSLMGR